MSAHADKPESRSYRRWPWLVALIAIAIASFGSYYQHGINFRDEGGTLTLLGQRLLNGEVPFRDVELGYNVGWFAPIVALFKITGVNFVALRVYCFALSTLAAVLGFLTVEKTARHASRHRLALPLAFVAGLMLIALPGMTFKNYNPLAAVANTWCLLGFVLAKTTREVQWRAVVGGLVLGATWLVRIDLGTLFTVLWLGTIFASLCARDLRITSAAASLAIVAAAVAVMHLPLAFDAKTRNYDNELVGSYVGEWKRMGSKLPLLVGATHKPNSPGPAPVAPLPVTSPVAAPPAVAEAPAPAPDSPPVPTLETPAVPAAPASTAPAAPPKQGAFTTDTLGRMTWNEVVAAKPDKRDEAFCFFILTYLPIFTFLPLIVFAAMEWLRGLRRGGSRTPLAALVLIGGSLTMFAQFFFWRPDASHLSEFGPGYWTALFGILALTGAGATWRSPARWFAILLVINAAVWMWRIFPDRWCGTIAARFDRKTLFEGENGVRVYETTSTAEWMREALQFVRENSKDTDYLVAFPYHPSFNVFTNRRTYERKLYIDNATASPKWIAGAIENIEKYKPRIIVVSDWAVNSTDASRFKNWGASVFAHICEKYDLKVMYDKKEKFEVYVRKE